uniref:Ion transport domain-containing protein n=1 Tax=Knipowitschia caucasica TaxID=637954 RepID=A0AAV2LZ70_KNICA
MALWPLLTGEWTHQVILQQASCCGCPSSMQAAEKSSWTFGEVYCTMLVACMSGTWIVLNRRWLKDVEKFLTFRTTSQLESFQNHILIKGQVSLKRLYSKKIETVSAFQDCPAPRFLSEEMGKGERYTSKEMVELQENPGDREILKDYNSCDLVAILPYYVSLLVDTSQGSGGSYLDKVGLVLRVLRALRILYVMRLARHSLGLQTLGLTARRCTREFGLLLLFLCVAIALYSPLLFLIETEMASARAPVQEFTSVPATYWWAVITMTTVGYGDMVPRSLPGQVVALSSILSGILLMAFPVTSIFHTFSRSYLELKLLQQRALHRRSRFLLHNHGNGASDLSLESDTMFPLRPDL